MRGERQNEKKLLNGRQPELEDLENSQHSHVAKKTGKTCAEDSPRGITRQPFGKEVSERVNYEFHQLCHQKPGIKMGLYQNTTTLDLSNRDSASLDQREQDKMVELFGCKHASSFRKGES